MLTQQQLEAHLWAAADILRGSIDSSDYKSYIFGILFLKRLSDVFEEEVENRSNLVAERYIAQRRLARKFWKIPTSTTFSLPEVSVSYKEKN